MIMSEQTKVRTLSKPEKRVNIPLSWLIMSDCHSFTDYFSSISFLSQIRMIKTLNQILVHLNA